MTTSMKAAFTLTLEDKLSSGLNAIKKGFDDLKNRGKELTLGKLERGGDMLRTLGEQVRELTGNLRSVEAVADRGWAAMRRMASVKFQGVEKQLFGKQGFRGPGHEIEQKGQLGAIGGVISGYSLVQPVQQYAGYENTLRHIAITEKLSGPAVETEIARIDKELRAEALATGQNSAELAKAYTFLITTGMKAPLVDELMPSHARAATAYNISSESMGQAVFALNDSFKIPAQDMGAALSAMAYAAKEAHFTVENFSQFLPQIGGRMQLLGMTGRPAADTAFAALETVVKNSSMPSQAAADFTDLMTYMTSFRAAHEFKQRAGIDLPGSLIAAEKKGINPFDEFMHILQNLVKGKTPVQSAEILGKILTNQEAATAALSILQHRDEFQRIRTELGTKDASTLKTDFDTAFRAPEVQLRIGKEASEQLDRRAGQGFDPIMSKMISGLELIVAGVNKADESFPKLTDAVLAVTGSLLAAAAALGAAGFIAPAVKAGGELLGIPTAAKWAWRGAKALGPFAIDAMPPLAAGALTYDVLKVGSAYETPEHRAELDKLHREERQGATLTPQDGYGPDGRPLNPSATDVTGAPGASDKLEVTVHTDPGTSVTVTRATPGLTVTVPNPGQTTNRP